MSRFFFCKTNNFDSGSWSDAQCLTCFRKSLTSSRSWSMVVMLCMRCLSTSDNLQHGRQSRIVKNVCAHMHEQRNQVRDLCSYIEVRTLRNTCTCAYKYTVTSHVNLRSSQPHVVDVVLVLDEMHGPGRGLIGVEPTLNTRHLYDSSCDVTV